MLCAGRLCGRFYRLNDRVPSRCNRCIRGALTVSLRILNPKRVSKALGREFDPFPMIRDIVQSELSEQLTEAGRRSERVGHNALEVIHR